MVNLPQFTVVSAQSEASPPAIRKAVAATMQRIIVCGTSVFTSPH